MPSATAGWPGRSPRRLPGREPAGSSSSGPPWSSVRGDISFEMLRDLTERRPLMVCQRWVNTRVQPIAPRDLPDSSARHWVSRPASTRSAAWT
ncbi:MAG: hypothetical protein ACLQPH_15325 [Acidimicrobiales bacterium]